MLVLNLHRMKTLIKNKINGIISAVPRPTPKVIPFPRPQSAA
jgi:hypothetical protein